ncbi:MAG: arginine deiminase-related protein [Dokdonella sp.]
MSFVIVDNAADFLAAADARRYPKCYPATARAAFLVAPDGFELAAESAIDNRYMAMDQRVDSDRARAQHAGLVQRLSASLPTFAFPGNVGSPDGLFPNNVFATANGRLIIGSMHHPVRRREAERHDIRGFFESVLGYETVDLSQRDLVAELTGALVIDRARGIGYCGLSDRCDRAGAQAMHEAFGLDLTFCFDLADGEYHTNVVLAVLAGSAVIIAADGFADPSAAVAIAQFYGGRALSLDQSQKVAYAANAITLDKTRVWMSATASNALRPDQRDMLERCGFQVESVELDEIEKAGGSLRCCVAEIF